MPAPGLPLPAKNRYHINDAEYREANQCRRKVKYTKPQAIRAASRLEEIRTVPFTVYECEYCAGWHVGHSIIQN